MSNRDACSAPRETFWNATRCRTIGACTIDIPDSRGDRRSMNGVRKPVTEAKASARSADCARRALWACARAVGESGPRLGPQTDAQRRSLPTGQRWPARYTWVNDKEIRMRTMKTITAAVAAALALGTTMSIRAETGDQDVPRESKPVNGLQPGVPYYTIKPGETPPADMRRDYDRATGNDRNRGGDDRNHDRNHGANNNHGAVVGPDGTYYQPATGYRPNEYRAWHRGERLPPEYNSRYYVVDDWRGHHLQRPPSGYHWVQSGSDYLLVAIATGIIASVILGQ